ncbi:MAG: hypothetical protein KGI37_06800 [Alphaproteobacteria bacterium]|nr:hypothetical protein [Alphaproteobacteria bacterium]
MTTARQIPLPLPHTTAMGADDYMVTACNREAAAWIEAWPQWPAHGLIVTGGSGSGKSHLMHLWLHRSRGRAVTRADLTTRNAIDLTADDAPVAIDDADALAGDAAGEEALFHLYNRVKSSGRSMLLTMKTGAGQTPFQLPDLRSRLLTLPVAALAAPDDDLLAALIVKQFADRQVALDAGVVSYLAARTARDAAAIRDLVDRLDTAALAAGRKVSIALARTLIEGQATEER